MSTYLRELSAGDIIKGSFEIYGKNFVTVFLIYTLPVLPLALLQAYLVSAGQSDGTLQENWPWIAITLILNIGVTTLAYGAVTVALSDICLGKKAEIGASYKFILNDLLWKLFLTGLLQALAILSGMILLIIPGLVVAIWVIFSSIIVVLEKKAGVEALKRSKELGKGFYWRTAGLMLLFILISAVFGGIVGGIIGVIRLDPIISQLTITLFSALVQPLVLVMLVLSYYDLRVRKESYSAETLTQELGEKA